MCHCHEQPSEFCICTTAILKYTEEYTLQLSASETNPQWNTILIQDLSTKQCLKMSLKSLRTLMASVGNVHILQRVNLGGFGALEGLGPLLPSW